MHGQIIRLILKTTGIDLSDLPSGDYNQALERLTNSMIRNEDFIPPSQAEYSPVRQRIVFKTMFKKSQRKPKDQKYLTWNTIR